jgi:hypothetical protein
MAASGVSDIPTGFDETCWRGVRFCHPADWEPARLSGVDEPAQVILVDRLYQRLDVNWKRLPREPDLGVMFERIGSGLAKPPSALAASAPWRGLVRKEDKGTIVHAARYFAPEHCLVQLILIWPGGRDVGIESKVLESVRPVGKGQVTPWRALRLSAGVPSEFEMIDAPSPAGRVIWHFRRAIRPHMELKIERIALPEYWLKTPLDEWLVGDLPPGFKVVEQRKITFAGHQADELVSRKGILPGVLGALDLRRIDRSWLCPREDHVYRVTAWRRGMRVEFPAGVEVRCSGP